MSDIIPNMVLNMIPGQNTGGGGGDGGTELTGPSFTYTNGDLTRIDYDGGEYKTLSYNGSGQLVTVVFVDGTTTITKSLSYNADGTLASITQT